MSYIKASITTSEYDNNRVNVQQLQSVTQYATNVTVVESQSIYSLSNDFNWSALDNSLEMNYYPDCSNQYALCFLSLIFPFLCPLIPYDYLDEVSVRKSQKLTITDTHIDFEHDMDSCCCFFASNSKVNDHISLDHIWMIRNDASHQKLDLLYGETHISIRGLNSRSYTPKLIKDAIVQRRRRKAQTKPYTIPQITSTFGFQSITLLSQNASIICSDSVIFIDGLGSVKKTGGGWFNGPSQLEFWSPPVGRERSGSGDGPEMTMRFRDEESCTTFKKAVEDTRDSFQ